MSVKFEDRIILDSNEFLQANVFWVNNFFDYTSSDILKFDFNPDELVISHFIEDELIKHINQKCGDNPLVVSIFLTACLSVLIHKYSGQKTVQIATGKPKGQKYLLDSELLFSKAVFEKDMAFVDFLNNYLSHVEKVIQNQHYPLEIILDEQKKSEHELCELYFIHSGVSNPVNLSDSCGVVIYSPEENKIEFRSRLDERTKFIGVNLLHHFVSIVEQTIQQPAISLHELTAVPASETERLLKDFNSSTVAYPSGSGITDLFAIQVKQTPLKTAVAFGQASMTYLELDLFSNRLAYYLTTVLAVKPGQRVAVLLDRSLQLPGVLLGILKAGAVYVPISTDYPQERVSFITTDSNAGLTINREVLQDFLHHADALPSDTPALACPAELPVYIMYTSGSTGTPKGVIVTNRNVVRLVKSDNYVLFSGEESILSTGNVSFDSSTFDYWGALLNGGKLVICEQNTLLDTKLLAAEITSQGVNTMFCTSGWFNKLVDTDPGVFKGLKSLLTGGDKVSVVHAHKLAKHYPELRIIHCYGPTENTTFSTTYLIKGDEAVIPIGKPISNTQVYILGPDRSLLPIGLTGEIYLGGDGVALGYLNREELSRERFLDNPFRPGDRLYKTGDLGRWLESGDIEFIGRNDSQVKIRGYRIEPDEIKNALLKHKAVLNAAVLVKGETSDDKELVAYITTKEKTDRLAVQEFLRKSLPEFMVPNQVLILDEFPLNDNGKLDLKALMLLKSPENSLEEASAPRNDTDRKLLKIWSDILGIKTIDISGNFFDLGGHSLKATELLVTIHETMDTELSISDIFEYPSLSELSDIIAKKSRQSPAPHEITTVPEARYYPLSASQKRIWLISQQNHASTAYNMPGVFGFHSELNIPCFQEAFTCVVNRHESLRTVFKVMDGMPVTEINPPDQAAQHVEFSDLSGDEGAEEKIKTLIHENATHLFDLEKGPLFRARIVKKGEQDFIFLFNVHHIVFDSVSYQILFSELSKAYDSLIRHEKIILPDLPLHFKEYAVWQSTQDFTEAYQFWSEQLSNYTPVNLSPDHKPLTAKTYKGTVYSDRLDREASNLLRKIAVTEQTTIFNVLLTVYKLLVFKLSGNTDFVAGTPVTGRTKPGLNSQIGFFVNTIPIRCTLADGELSFKSYLSETKEHVASCIKHSDYPIDQLIETLSNSDSIFNLFFTVYKNEAVNAVFNGSEINVIDSGLSTSKFDMLMSFVDDNASAINIDVEYNSDLYQESTIRRYIEIYKHIVSSVTASIDAPLSAVQYLSASETERLLKDFNSSTVAYPSGSGITDLFAIQVKQTPLKTAVAFGQASMTYLELDLFSNRLAYYLTTVLAVKPGQRVAVLLDRSLQLPGVLLGILKAGAVYVPISTDYPQERVSFITTDSNAGLTINREVLQDFLHHADALPSDTPALACPAELPVYIMYTSGSTGTPKGVIVTNRNVVRLVKSDNYVLFSGEESILSTGNVSFDSSTFDYWGALLNGGKLVICEQNTLLDTKLLAAEITSQGVNTMFCTSGWFNKLVDTDPGVFKGLKSLLTGGDKVSVVHAHKLAKHYPELRIIHCYGPTENTTFSTTYLIKGDEAVIPIGKPISNTQVYILGPDRSLLPIGLTGEIYLGGDGVALGYLNREELSRERFLDNPFRPGDRLYKTGDLGRWLESGDIEFIGRNDSQVKIRGYRIEPDEIKNALLKHKAVLNAAVLVKGETSDDKELVAYITTKEKTDRLAVQEFLRKSLPEFMVPNQVLILDEFPLNDNGKLDLKALQHLSETGSDTGAGYLSPRTETEIKLSKLWKNLFSRKQVSLHDDFFDLGGNSLKVIKLTAAINHEFNVDLSIKDILTDSTLQTLAHKIDSVNFAETVYSVITPDEAAKEEPFPMTQVQLAYLWGRENEFEMGGGSSHAYVETDLAIDIERLQVVVNKLIARHPMLRTIFSFNGTQQVLPYIPEYAVEHDDISSLSPEEQEKEIRRIRNRMSHFVFQPDQWPLFEIKALKIKPTIYKLFYGIDPLIVDMTSTMILNSEFERLYADVNAELPELKITFRDYILKLKEIEQLPVYERDRSYWLDKIRDFPESPKLSLKQNPDKIATPSFKRLFTTFDRNTWNTIQDLCRLHKVTTTALLSTVYMEVLSYWSNQPKLAINLTVANRLPLHEDIDSILGDFTTIMILGTDLLENHDIWSRTRAVQSELWDALHHKHYDGIHFIREFSKHHHLGKQTVFPYVFTSALSITGQSDENAIDELDSNYEQSITQTSQVFIDNKAVSLKDKLLVEWDYAEDLFEQEQIQQMFKQYVDLIQHIGNNLYSGSLPSVPSLIEKTKIYNETWSDIPASNLVELFEASCLAFPQQIAVKMHDESISYKDLDLQSNAVADYLIGKGVRSGDFVGVYGERHPATVIYLLGILKTGAAYVPIDPAYPEDRRDYIIQNSDCNVVLSSGDLAEAMKYSDGRKKVSTAILPDQPAYIIYTSGSTGRPKGVLIQHQAVCNTLLDLNQRFKVNKNDKVIGLSSFSFDLSVYDVFGTLSAGATLVLIDDQRDAEAVLNAIRQEHISIWNSVPAIMKNTLERISGLSNDTFPDLRLVILSGDWIPLDLPPAIKQSCPNAALISMGGATEASIWSIYYPVNEVKKEWRSIPYGYPLANQQFYVLDYNRRICPVDVEGDLYIGGTGLAAEYYHAPELTENAFIHTPPFGRLYKTGDRGRFKKENFIEFSGRKDDQVKIRGYRVELGEIEAGLSQLSKLAMVKVIAPYVTGFQRELVVFYQSNEDIGDEEMKAHLKGLVPGYMVPSYYIKLEKFPLSQNGKVDHKALLGLVNFTNAAKQDTILWDTEIEFRLSAVFKALLKTEAVDVQTSFFDLGANSLLLTKVINFIEKEFETKVNFKQILEFDTIAKLSAHLLPTLQRDNSYFNKAKQDIELSAHAYLEKDKFYILHISNPDADAKLLSLNDLENESAIYKKFLPISRNRLEKELLRIEAMSEEEVLRELSRIGADDQWLNAELK